MRIIGGHNTDYRVFGGHLTYLSGGSIRGTPYLSQYSGDTLLISRELNKVSPELPKVSPELPQPNVPVRPAKVNILMAITARSHMVETARQFHSQRSCHKSFMAEKLFDYKTPIPIRIPFS